MYMSHLTIVLFLNMFGQCKEVEHLLRMKEFGGDLVGKESVFIATREIPDDNIPRILRESPPIFFALGRLET